MTSGQNSSLCLSGVRCPNSRDKIERLAVRSFAHNLDSLWSASLEAKRAAYIVNGGKYVCGGGT